MKKIFVVLAGLSVPATLFAAHTAHCCGHAWCCLLHLGCC